MDQSQEAKPVTVDWGAILNTLRRPRVTFVLLAAWGIIGAISEFFSDSFLFDLDQEADGALGGRALSAEAIPLAVLYLYAARNPERYRFVLWIAVVEQAVALVANIVHWRTDDFAFKSVILPIVVAIGFLALLIPNLVQRTREELPLEPQPSSRRGPQQP